MNEEGQYTGIFENAYGEESRNGTPCVVTKWRLDQDEEEFVYVRTYFSLEKSRDISYAKMGRLGWNGDMEEPTFQVDTVLLNCKHEEWEGNLKERWDFAFAREAQPVDDGKASEVAAGFKQFLKNNPVSVSKPAAPATDGVPAARDKAYDAFCEHKATNADDPTQTAKEWRAHVKACYPDKDETDLTVSEFTQIEADCIF